MKNNIYFFLNKRSNTYIKICIQNLNIYGLRIFIFFIRSIEDRIIITEILNEFLNQYDYIFILKIRVVNVIIFITSLFVELNNKIIK